MEGHIKVVGILHILLNLIGILLAFAFFMGFGVLGLVAAAEEPVALGFYGALGSAFATCFLIFSLPGIIGGIGLLQGRNWARILLIILAALGLFSFPIGTALGVYTLWVLLQDETSELLY